MKPTPIGKHHLIATAQKLGDLLEESAFVGGAILFTYLNEAFYLQARPTFDLDIAIQLAHYGELEAINQRLANKGFYPDKESDVICRYTDGALILDVMPTNEEILGFSNRWYASGLEHKEWIELEKEIRIPRFPLSYYLASKWEAAFNRGGDLRYSKDLEDIITLTNHTEPLDWKSDADVNNYLKASFLRLLEGKYARELIVGHLSGIDRQNADLIIEKIKGFLNN